MQVHAGKAGPFWYACIQYEMEIDIWLIVGVVLLLGIPLILLIITIAAVYVNKQRMKQKSAMHNDSNDLEMSPVVDEHGPSDVRRAERQVSSCYLL